jgi:hypothetical protein
MTRKKCNFRTAAEKNQHAVAPFSLRIRAKHGVTEEWERIERKSHLGQKDRYTFFTWRSAIFLDQKKFR